MKRILLLLILIFGMIARTEGQSRRDLEDQRKKTLEEIAYVDNLLKETAREKKESLNELKIIGRKLNLRELILQGLQEEISLICQGS
jgi:hypothetical protein